MFKINYRVTDSIEELKNLPEREIEEGISIDGYFELEINNKKYGYFKKGPLEVDEYGSELITDWFEQLLEVLIELKKGRPYVALNVIDSYNTWLEFKHLEGKMINVSVIEAKKKDGIHGVVIKPLGRKLLKNNDHTHGTLR